MQDPTPPTGYTGWQYKVTYDRRGWNRPRLRYFSTITQVEEFCRQELTDTTRPPLTKLHYVSRPVGPWGDRQVAP